MFTVSEIRPLRSSDDIGELEASLVLGAGHELIDGAAGYSIMEGSTMEASMAQPPYWFAAKRYGWGWGPPKVWQGWVVLIVFAAALFASGIIFLPGDDTTSFLGCALGLCALLVGVCHAKGEPPRWRWGK